MNGRSSAAQQVKSVLAERAMPFGEESGPRLRLAHGSAEVLIDFDDLRGSASMVRVGAIVLSGVRAGNREQELLILRALNDRNLRNRFGRFSYDAESGAVLLSYEMLADHLQPEEIINAVTSVARAADDHDDVLANELGGVRAADRAAGST